MDSLKNYMEVVDGKRSAASENHEAAKEQEMTGVKPAIVSPHGPFHHPDASTPG